MEPVIALVGCPNVGKSTLFNRLTRSRDAIVADLPGITRDRIYGSGEADGTRFLVIDTGGIGASNDTLNRMITQQVEAAIDEADAVLMLVDGRGERSAGDEEIARRLRKISKPVYLVVNKAEGLDIHQASSEFQALGMGQPMVISAAHGDGVGEMVDTVLAGLPSQPVPAEDDAIVATIVGRPNVGKSTLVNCLLGEERVLAYDAPGTTRDCIRIPFTRHDEHFVLVDTAGVRRRGRSDSVIEKFSVIKTMQAISASHVAILVMDATTTVSDQDVRLLGHVLKEGRGVVIAVNKWDCLGSQQRREFQTELSRRLDFVDFAEVRFISALAGHGIDALLRAVLRAYRSAMGDFATPRLTRILEEAVHAHAPPLVRNRRIKLRYAHQGGHNPPLIVIHGNQTEQLPVDYRRFLANYFRRALQLVGTPLRLEFKSGANPYQGRKNPLTDRQLKHRHRLRRLLRKRS